MTKKCIWCPSQMEADTTVCPICQHGQIIKIPDSRLGDCNCKSGDILLVTISGNGRDDNYCKNCITQPIAMKLVAILEKEKVNFPTTLLEKKVLSIGRNSRFSGYNFPEQTLALEATLGSIHSAKERAANSSSSRE
ncbi:MAG: hypothetical protein UV57_C0007G0003 [Parcubacteria group bacterium GW2011_GWD2_43_10]|nr:MAG: hypothetical protein UV52_C0022G0004 [Parcubacteria group bacterium GW2011_GWD1_42_9]KKS83737.1 MAG: hypothetical protein UV57_C0007G0003 [Parcubacteria group bacterium GW2011_GWD2_43_10]KKS93070.1 MAG: hypothetical protein UV69_C0014G0012 [Parcubacteria group bacterium GW2011_GWE2_43_12]KKT12918.1 MAG: hypothetical protein UV92_C0020G0004 [Parcubacteria group bacterium GW2011_GWA1_43_27]KKT14347.1 MAG: hypothetical protein UV96_C0034G0004 [Parcubacteria group bacterium GW2011_GWF2_43_3